MAPGVLHDRVTPGNPKSETPGALGTSDPPTHPTSGTPRNPESGTPLHIPHQAPPQEPRVREPFARPTSETLGTCSISPYARDAQHALPSLCLSFPSVCTHHCLPRHCPGRGRVNAGVMWGVPKPPAPIKPPLSHYPAGHRQRGGPCPPGTQRLTVPAVVWGPLAWQPGDQPPARVPPASPPPAAQGN